MNLEDFEILKDNNLIYFDNGATTLKPRQVVEEIVNYYTKYSANAHRGDYDISSIVDKKYEDTRKKVRDFINAEKKEEIVFTKGTTESLNMVAFGYAKNYLLPGDEVLITKAEHASNILPWLELQKQMGIVVNYIPLDENHEVTIENVEKVITNKTKIISVAHITNVVGDIRPVEEIGRVCKERDIIFAVDAAQSVGHMAIDVVKSNISFLAFSAHKMLGPTGVGVLYGKKDLLEKVVPLEYGGGMNASFESSGEIEYKLLPERLEAGTQNIAGVLGLGRAIDYLLEIGLDKIHEHELELKKYALEKLKEVPNINIYNKKSKSGIIIFNLNKVEGITNQVFSQDLALFLNNFNICVRAGNHCAKIVKEEIRVTNTCRASFYIYNTKKEIDKLVHALKRQEEIYDKII